MSEPLYYWNCSSICELVYEFSTCHSNFLLGNISIKGIDIKLDFLVVVIPGWFYAPKCINTLSTHFKQCRSKANNLNFLMAGINLILWQYTIYFSNTQDFHMILFVNSLLQLSELGCHTWIWQHISMPNHLYYWN